LNNQKNEKLLNFKFCKNKMEEISDSISNISSESLDRETMKVPPFFLLYLLAFKHMSRLKNEH
jgi:hypothetical protein